MHDRLLQCHNLLLLIVDYLLQRCEFIKLLCLRLLRLHSFPHSIRYRGLIQSLIGQDRHFNLVPHAHKQEAPLCTVYCCLADQLVKCLRVEIFSNRTDAGLTSLALLEFFVEL